MTTRTPLGFEELESRTLLSATGLLPPALAGALLAPAVTHAATLNGTITGSFSTSPGHPDMGLSYNLTGAGHLGNLGHFSMTGSLHGTGFLATGHATGTITLSNAHGSITLKLTGPEQPGFSPLPQKFNFAVECGTHSYRHMADSGTVTVHFDQVHHTFSLTIHEKAK